jgi:transcriptional regulator with GAF, ATPase, and Fis domain
VKLLRVLETQQFERVGDHRPISVDVRIITATNKNLGELIAQNKFREDFFFRINVIPIHIPPLRDRLEDVPVLVNTFIHNLRSRTGDHLPLQMKEAQEEKFLTTPFSNQGIPKDKKDLIDALRKSKGNKSQAARILGVNRVTVWNRMKKYGINLAPDWDRI